VHLPFDDIYDVIRNFKKSGAPYLLMTTFPQRSKNLDCLRGYWRPLNFCCPPFNFPEPLKIINEGCYKEESGYPDKSLGLWRLSSIVLLRSNIEMPKIC
ncbi:MAG: hypothetical protein PHS88_03425, partial [Candidatus Omnitrophica bacterium]|nr:hypothetical protein [Candidatus Omnitrophota bacterium]